MSAPYCTCQFGRASDGSEHGPCPYCEEMAWRDENGMHDEDLEAMIEDEDPETEFPARPIEYTLHGSTELDADAEKLLALGQDPGITFDDL